MKSHARTTKAAAAALVAVPLTLGVLVVPTGTAATGGVDTRAGCRLDPRYLPHTPDAVEGWYRSCLDRRLPPVSRSATRAANGEGPLASTVAVEWQQTAIRTIFGETVPTPAPPVGAMYLSFMSLAVHDAARKAQRMGSHAATAAVATAAHDVLHEYFPASRARLDADLVASLASVPDGRQEAEGARVGEAAADRMIASRVGDGRGDTTVVYTKDPGLGVWQPPTGGVMAIAWLAFLDPVVDVPTVVLDGHDPLGSPAYAEDYEEVRTIGAVDSQVRTAEQTAIARFFSRNPVLEYRDALCRYLESEPLGLLPTTRLFARIDAAQVTAFIQTWRLKYDVGFWRPFQAIAAAESDGNPGTLPHPGTWVPLVPNPSYSDYTSGHAAATAPFAEVLRHTLGDDVPLLLRSGGLERTYETLSALEHDALLARIWGGLHFRDAMDDGYLLGHTVADQVIGAIR